MPGTGAPSELCPISKRDGKSAWKLLENAIHAWFVSEHNTELTQNDSEAKSLITKVAVAV